MNPDFRPKIIVLATMSLDGRILSEDQRERSLMRSPYALLTGCTCDGDLHSCNFESALPPYLRVIVCEGSKVDPKWKIFSKSTSMMILYTNNKKIPRQIACKIPSSVQVAHCPSDDTSFESMLDMLVSCWGIKTLWCESDGNPNLLKKLFVSGNVDELIVTMFPILGSKKKGSFTITGSHSEKFLAEDLLFQLISVKKLSGKLRLHYRRGGIAVRVS